MRADLVRTSCLVSFVALFAVAPAAPAAEEDPIEKAIKRGAKYLQGIHKPGRDYAGGSLGMGTATLAGLALLESGVPDSDPAVRTIARYIRDNALAQTSTYQVSLTIMFLDRFGHEADRPIIQFLGVRLMAGQGKTGGWSYDCGYGFSPQDEARLKAMFIKESRLVSAPARKDAPPADPVKKGPAKSVPRPDLPEVVDSNPPTPDPKTNPVKKDPPAPPKPVDEKSALHPEVLRWARLISQDAQKGGAGGGFKQLFGDGDNSNTQFAALGLWCARKHGLPCDKALGALETRFRTSQEADGGWNYSYSSGGAGNATATMTCAGLIGLALAHGTHQSVLRNKIDGPVPKANDDPKKGPVDPEDDKAIKKGLKRLGDFITDATGKPPQGKIIFGRRGPRFKLDDLNGNLYFLWSLERVAMIYGLETIGNHDWYVWGADSLIDSQQANGSWNSVAYPGANEEISTCFALLFLNRANVARDLSTALKGKIKDPGVAVLRGGADLAKVFPEAAPAKTEPKRDPMTTIDPLLPHTPARTGNDFETEAARLCALIVVAADDARPDLLKQLRDSKGSVYTEALARAAAKTSGELQQEIREALARRLTRMTVSTLREMLKDDNREVRLAAASACGRKEDRQFIPDLIAVLSDADGLVGQASRISLRSLTGKDFGPMPGAAAAETAKTISAWKSWWKSQETEFVLPGTKR